MQPLAGADSGVSADGSTTLASQQLPQPESSTGHAAGSDTRTGVQANHSADINTASVSFPATTLPTEGASALSPSSLPSTMSTHATTAHRLQAPLRAGRAISTISAASDTTSLSLNTEYTGPIIPPASDTRVCNGRTLVLCFDGTGDEFDQDNSNVILFFSLLKKGDHNRQLVYYQSGIGTYTIPQVATPLYSTVSKTLDLMIAKNLNHHVMSGYKFLMQNYKDGDRICILGFSRGAYVSRSLAGMLHKVGLLPEGNEQQVPFAYRMYLRDDELGWKQSILFKRSFSINVDIQFVGVWDTVASVGLLPKTLPFTQSNTAIRTFRHAVSLDEHRTKFKPSLHRFLSPEEAKRRDSIVPWPKSRRGTVDMKTEVMKAEVKREITGGAERARSLLRKKQHKRATSDSNVHEVKKEELSMFKSDKRLSEDTRPSTSERREHKSSVASEPTTITRSSKSLTRRKDEAMAILENVKKIASEVAHVSGSEDDHASPTELKEKLEAQFTDKTKPTDVEEVWFAGCHCDIGGGSVANDTPNSLARIPLRWMIRQCFLAKTGIQFEAERLREIGMEPETLYPEVIRRPHPDDETPEDTEDTGDKKGTTATTTTTTVRVSTDIQTRSAAIGTEKKRNSWLYAPKMSRRWRKSSGDRTLVEGKFSVCSSSREKSEDGERDADAADRDREGSKINIDVETTTEDGSIKDAKGPHASSGTSPTSNTSPSGVAIHNPPGTSTTTSGHIDSHMRAHARAQRRIHRRSTSELQQLLSMEESEEKIDALSPMYDQLKIAKAWWILEFLPWRDRILTDDGSWKKCWSINRGKPRIAPQVDEPMRVHRSVKLRMQDPKLNYTPRVKFERKPVWVD